MCGLVVNLLQGKEGGVVVVDQTAHHTPIREGRGEVGYLRTLIVMESEEKEVHTQVKYRLRKTKDTEENKDT